jgi:hypothetical protein
MSYPFKPQINILKLEELIKYIPEVFSRFPDFRKGAPQSKYTMRDVAVSAFSVFFMQCPSFLAHQRDMHQKKGISNLRTLFLVQSIPSDNWVRQLLDLVSPEWVFPLFGYIVEALKQTGHLEKLKSINDNWLISLDGTEYFSSHTIHGEQCTVKHHKKGTITYSHSVLTPVLVSPKSKTVISLEPEFITPQDGALKQDCENRAAKRWLNQYAKRYKEIGVTILGDDLYSHQPLCQLILDQGLNFILVCKPNSHTTLYEWVDSLQATEDIKTKETYSRRGNKHTTYRYRFVNGVPLRDGNDALNVNWCELTILNENGNRTCQHSFITNHLILEENVAEIIQAGRTRWKIENENNNTLKTKGYHLEHNFGHGQKYLSSVLLTLNLLAFLLHTVLEMMDSKYQLVRNRLGTRETFFHDIRALTRYHYFNNWAQLFHFMWSELEFIPTSHTKMIRFDSG